MDDRVYQVNNLKKVAGERTILNVEQLEVGPGELFVIVGPNGAGKSTLLRLLHFLEPATSGEIIYRGKRVSHPAALGVRRELGMVFQRPELLDASVQDNVIYPLQLRGISDRERVESVMEQLDLMSLANAHAGTLSGGELQRVAVARVLVSRPKVIFMDEPTANLDPRNAELIEEIISALHAQGTTIILVTHNVFQARRLAERVGFLLNGQVVEVSPVEQFFEAPRDARASAFIQGQMVY